MKINRSHESVIVFLTCVDVFYILTKMDFKMATNKGKQSLSHDGYTYRVNYQLKTGGTTWRCINKHVKLLSRLALKKIHLQNIITSRPMLR